VLGEKFFHLFRLGKIITSLGVLFENSIVCNSFPYVELNFVLISFFANAVKNLLGTSESINGQNLNTSPTCNSSNDLNWKKSLLIVFMPFGVLLLQINGSFLELLLIDNFFPFFISPLSYIYTAQGPAPVPYPPRPDSLTTIPNGKE
jgi:hypothetical protein